MSSSTSEESQLEINKDKPSIVNSNYDNKTTAAETRRKASTMTRRLSFSSRPWSSYAENYSSCLSGLRRNSSEQLIKRQGSLQSSPSSSSNDLSKSMDSGQLRYLKATTPTSDVKPRPFKISAMHARPFHQRRWSSPVAFSVTKLAPSSQQTSKQLNEENGSSKVLQDRNEDKNKDKICETDEIILSQNQDKTPVSTEQVTVKSDKQENKATESMLNGSSAFSAFQTEEISSVYPVGQSEAMKMSGNQPKCANDKSNSEDKEEDPTQSRNIYTEIKKNTKWTKSRRFRRRHHTIHADSRRFINPTLFTIAEQSSGSFGSVVGNGTNRRTDGIKNAKLINRRSKSLGDLNTLPDDMQSNGVSVQQLCAKSICVSVESKESEKNEKKPPVTTTRVIYKGKEKSENNSERNRSCPVQVNIQTFNKIQITPVVDEECKPQASKIHPHYSTQQHAVFTQPKAKWTSITISQV